MKNTTQSEDQMPISTISAKQLGEFLGGLTVDDVVELVETTDIPHRRTAGEVRFDRVEIDAWLQTTRVPARPRSSGNESP